MKKILSLSILLIISNLMFAQINQKKCITNKIVLEALKSNPEYDLMRQNLINYHQENREVNPKNQTVITIPVVIHVVHRAARGPVGLLRGG